MGLPIEMSKEMARQKGVHGDDVKRNTGKGAEVRKEVRYRGGFRVNKREISKLIHWRKARIY